MAKRMQTLLLKFTHLLVQHHQTIKVTLQATTQHYRQRTSVPEFHLFYVFYNRLFDLGKFDSLCG